MDSKNSFLTTPVSILLGSFVISIAILMHGGIIKISPKTPSAQVAVQPATSAQPAQQPAQPSAATLNDVKNAFTKSVVKFGDANKKLVVVEVADPSCPYCSIAAGKNPELNKQSGSRFTLVADGGSYVAPVPEIEKLVKDGKIAFAYVYFPGHGNGEMGAKALYCANDQGKFWEVHDLLMSSSGYDLLNNKVKNDKSKSGDMADFLQSVSNATAIKACLDSGKYDNRLKDDMALAQSLAISGTPGFYLNAVPFTGAYSYKDMESTVKTALGI